LAYAGSNEPDDAPGDGDGSTTGDVSGAAVGTADPEVDLRAERTGTGSGRVYTLRYESADASGNVGSGVVEVQVPRDVDPGTEPMALRLEHGGTGGRAWIYWSPVDVAMGYDLITGDMSLVAQKPNALSLGQVTVLASGTQATDLLEGSGSAAPGLGKVAFYVMQYHVADGSGSGYGSVSAALPREPTSCGGGCP
jgi:hypothetical protein